MASLTAEVLVLHKIVKSFVCPAKVKNDFEACCPSPHGDYIFAVAEDHNLYCFTVATGNMERMLPVKLRGKGLKLWS